MKTCFNNFFIIIVIIMSLLSFYSCDLTEPERFYNDEPEKPQQGSVNFFDLDDTKHYAGHLTIKFKVDDLSFSTAALNVYLDEKLIWTHNSSTDTIEFQIYTPGYSEGLHTLRVHLVAKGMGYFTLFNVPSLEFIKQLYFDQSVPTAVTLSGYEWDGMHPRLNWTKSNSLNFDHYKIEKSNYGVYQTVYKIYDIDSTSFLIADIYKACSPDFGTYRISVSNSVAIASSNSINIKYGKQLPFKLIESNGGNWFTEVPDKNLIANLRLDSAKLNIMSYENGAIIHSISTSDISIMPYNNSNNHLLLATSDKKITKLDLDNFTLSSVTSIPRLSYFPRALAEGQVNRLILVDQYLRLLDITNGTCLDSIFLQIPNYHSLCLNSDRSKLFLSYENYLYYYSLAGDSITLIKKVSISETRLFNMEYSELRNQIIGFYNNGDMLFFNSETLNLVTTHHKSLCNGFDISISGQNLYVSYWTGSGLSSTEPRGIVVKYDLVTMQELKEWVFMDQVRYIFAYEPFDKLYAFCDDYTSWLIDLSEGK